MTKPSTRLITSRDEMRDELARGKPTRIAVGYLSAGWKDLLGKKPTLKELVVSPRTGTDSKAVTEIAKRIGWKNVHLLEQLHAKLYIGPRSMMLGSANLSTNAMGEGGGDLFELMMVTGDAGLRRQANSEFDRYRDIAQSEFTSDDAKIERLKVLEEANMVQRKAQSMGDAARRRAPHIADFVPGRDRIFLEWFDGTSSVDGRPGDRDWRNVLLGKGAKVRYGDWVLIYCVTPNGNLRKNLGLGWMRVDEIRRDSVDDCGYTDQIAETHRPPPGSWPFKLDDKVAQHFRKALLNHPDLWPTIDRPMPTPSRKEVDAFLADVVARAKAIN